MSESCSLKVIQESLENGLIGLIWMLESATLLKTVKNRP